MNGDSLKQLQTRKFVAESIIKTLESYEQDKEQKMLLLIIKHSSKV